MTRPRRHNPVVPDRRQRLHPSDVRRLEQLESRWRAAVAQVEAAYAAGDLDRAEDLDVEAERLEDELESVASAYEEGEFLTGGSDAYLRAPLDAQEILAYYYREWLYGQDYPRDVASRYHDRSVREARALLAQILRGELRASGYQPTSSPTDDELIEAARDAYGAQVRLRQHVQASIRRRRRG